MKKLLGVLVLLAACGAAADQIGEVDTVFKFIGPDHKIVVDAHDDPSVGGVTCYVSRAKTGGIKGALGLAEDKAEASIACRQVGPIVITKPLPQQEDVFTERISLVFKKLRIVRMVDVKRNTFLATDTRRRSSRSWGFRFASRHTSCPWIAASWPPATRR